MHPYSKKLLDTFRKHHKVELAPKMEAYMRNRFPFLGINSPHRKELESLFFKANGLPDIMDLKQVVNDLWKMPEREFHYTALTIYQKMRKKINPDFDFLQHLITTNTWWDTVDTIAPNLAGFYVMQDAAYTKLMDEWSEADNFWLRRSAIIHQLKFKDKTDFERLKKYCDANKHDDEFFIRKAIGWALREYAKQDAFAVMEYVNKADLKNLSRKEALKHIEQ